MLDITIEKKIAELPANIRNAVESFDWSTEVLHIAHDNHIQIDDIEKFRNETLLVIVGLTDARDYEKNLISRMGITHELAEKLVLDANEHIFRPLQKIAFTRHNDDEIEEDDEIYHDEISSEFQDHGIKLVDEFEPEPQPKNELQDLVDGIFNDETDNSSLSEAEPQTNNDKPVEVTNYNEPIETKDLKGISGHRIATDILKQSSPDAALINKENDSLKKLSLRTLDISKLKTASISKTESFDVSPTKQELSKEAGEYLKQMVTD